MEHFLFVQLLGRLHRRFKEGKHGDIKLDIAGGIRNRLLCSNRLPHRFRPLYDHPLGKQPPADSVYTQ